MVVNHRIGEGTYRAIVPLMKEEEKEEEEEEKQEAEEEKKTEKRRRSGPVCASCYYSVLLCSDYSINFTSGPTNGKQ
jgi:hypothetical protein